LPAACGSPFNRVKTKNPQTVKLWGFLQVIGLYSLRYRYDLLVHLPVASFLQFKYATELLNVKGGKDIFLEDKFGCKETHLVIRYYSQIYKERPVIHEGGGQMKANKFVFALGTGGFLVTALFLSGCVTAPKKIVTTPVVVQPAAVVPPPHKVTQDVKVFRALQQIDLDNDGSKEIVAIYDTTANICGVKVLKDVDNQAQIIFEQVFDDPNVKFEVVKGTPKILFCQPVQNTGYKVNRSYSWNGKTFTLDPEK
jgi:hypothetical protein